MKILVCISKTPDTTAKIAFADNNTKFAADGVQWIINPYDEWYSLVRAIELKEADASAVIHLVTVGPPDCDPIIRKALALGGDEAIRINDESRSDGTLQAYNDIGISAITLLAWPVAGNQDLHDTRPNLSY